MVSSVSVKTMTARCSLAGTTEFTGSLTVRRSCIRYPEEWARSGAEGCFAIAKVVFGSERSTRGSYTSTMESRMYLDCLRGSQVKPVTYFLKIAKAVSG